MKLYNTLTRQPEPVTPKIPGKVGLYYCGPTVYDVPHVGHARSAVVFDVLTRTLRARGLRVTQVRNITDVEDKILKRAAENGESPLALSRRMTDIYREDMAAVGCLAPDHEPLVSDHIPQIVALIADLVKREAAYVVDMPSGTRDVYFSVSGFGRIRQAVATQIGRAHRRRPGRSRRHEQARSAGFCPVEGRSGWRMGLG